MKLTVDASVVVKWFVDEPLSEESRLLLAHRLELFGPEIMLSEFANTIWKKLRQGEIPDENPYFDELAAIPEIVNLIPDINHRTGCTGSCGYRPSGLRLPLPRMCRDNRLHRDHR